MKRNQTEELEYFFVGFTTEATQEMCRTKWNVCRIHLCTPICGLQGIQEEASESQRAVPVCHANHGWSRSFLQVRNLPKLQLYLAFSLLCLMTLAQERARNVRCESWLLY